MPEMTRRSFLQAGAAAAMLPAFSHGAADRPPNILFFFPDQHRHDWVGSVLPGAVRTPHIDALGARGMRFTHCWCPSPVCAPSRACLASGREYPRCHVPSNKEDYPADAGTFYQELRTAGYSVLGCGKFDLNKGEQRWGLDGKYKLDQWGFSDGVNNAGKYDAIRSGRETPADPYMQYLHDQELVKAHLDDYAARTGQPNSYTNTRPTPLPEAAYCDNWIAAHGPRLIEEAPEDKPWFLQINFAGPHNPMDITQRMDGDCRGLTPPPPNQSTEYDAEQHRATRQNYSAMVENIDRWLGIYLEKLAANGQLDNTLIVYSSDHGEMLGDHNLWAKSKPHEPSVGVPLCISGPGIVPGAATDALVSLIDLPATFLQCAGLPGDTYGDGRSLWPLLRRESASHRDHIFSALDGWRAVRGPRWKLVEGYPDAESTLLFDLREDPFERENLAGAHAGEVARLRALLAEYS